MLPEPRPESSISRSGLIFVTGATGFVGQEIVRTLYARGHRSVILVRKRESRQVRDLVERYQAEARVGDVTVPESLVGALRGTVAVIHLVGIISELGKATFETVHTEGTRNILKAARDQEVNRFIHMSALGTRANAESRYHQSKWAGEE